jgi:hypothetical protein
MATVVELTQIQIGQQQASDPGQYIIEGSETPLSLNQANIIGVSEYWDALGEVYLPNTRLIYLSTSSIIPIAVTDSYATIAGYITANI